MTNKTRDNYDLDSDARMVTEEDLNELKFNKKVDNNIKKNKNIESNNDKKVDFNKKFFLCAFLVILFSILAAFFIKRSYAILGEQNITYQENSDLDYKVYLKKNDFYESEYLNKDMVYVASLIDKIDVNFNYIFNISKKSNIDFTYDIIGKLIISDKSNGNTFFEKEYVLLDKVDDTMTSDGLHQINKSVSIDYGKYNNLANQFKSKYGVDANSRLVVYLNIHEKSKNNNFNLNNTSNMSLSIPLSERAINISMDYNEVNKTSKLVRDKQFVITNYLFVVLGAIFIVLLIITLVKFIKMLLSIRIKRSKYDKYVNRLLREYDRLIVETATAPNHINNKDVVEILKFQELLDVRDNLKLPIKYYIVKDHKECYFYINHEEELYIFKVSANELEKD